MKRGIALFAAFTVAACGGGGQPPIGLNPAPAPAFSGVLSRAAIGFSVDTPPRASTAAREGITGTILYGSAPAPGSPLAKALASNGISTIDGGVSSDLYYWECYRTLTVKPPPHGYTWCSKYEKQIKSTAALLRAVEALLRKDANRPYVTGYWVLDDWPWWDYGSAHDVLQQVRAAIARMTPGRPAVCGFGAGVGRPGKIEWDPGLARNYSNEGCDAVAWYVYSPFGVTHPSKGRDLDWSMTALLPAIARSLQRHGWQMQRTPLVGIGQAWSGSYNRKYYQPGLSRTQVRAQAEAFCRFGAASIAWYAWDDSGFEARTQTPNDSPVIAAGISDGLSACKAVWGAE